MSSANTLAGNLQGLLERAARVGSWVQTLPDAHVKWSPQLAILLERAERAGAELSPQDGLAIYAPRWGDTMSAAIYACQANKVSFDEEAQVITASGRHVWVRSRGAAQVDELGVVTHVYGTVEDLSEKKQAEQEAVGVTVRLGATLASITEAFVTLDTKGCFGYVNPESERLLGRGIRDLMGKPIWQELDPDAKTKLQARISVVLRDSTDDVFEEFYAPLGKWLEVRAHSYTEGVAVFFRDVSEQRLSREQLLLLETSISRLNDMVVITQAEPLDTPGPRIVFVNAAFERRTGYSRAEVLGQTPRLLQGKGTQRATLDHIRQALERAQPVRAELINYTKDGEAYWIELEIVPIDDAARGLTHWVAVARDISERKASEDEIERLAFYDALTELPNRQMLMTRLEQALSQTQSRRSGYVEAGAASPTAMSAETGLPARAAVLPTMMPALSPTTTARATPVRETSGEPLQPDRPGNRREVLHADQQALHALMFIDLDHFKVLNDTMGHATGDLLLQKVAVRLAGCVRLNDTVARLGGDEFVVMLQDIGGGDSDEPDDSPSTYAMSVEDKARTVGEKIIDALSEPFDLAGHIHHCTCSIGITLFGNKPITLSDVLKQADLAMYQAKAAGRNGACFFDPAMQSLVTANAALNSDLRRGLRAEEFTLHYQPQVGRDGRMFGVEALLRWNHPERGLMMPDEFVAQAEESGLILPLGEWVLETACRQLATWSQRPETNHLSIAVNVSMRQFRHPEFVDSLLNLIARTGIPARRLKLELTESLLATGMEVTIAKMGMLKDAGVTLSIDDFGIGYSALSYLKYLPLDQLKIDRSFVRDVLTDPNDAAIARTIIGLAQSLGLDVVAEGVETEAQRAFLARHGCESYQGWLFCKALPIEALETFMHAIRQGESRA